MERTSAGITSFLLLIQTQLPRVGRNTLRKSIPQIQMSRKCCNSSLSPSLFLALSFSIPMVSSNLQHYQIQQNTKRSAKCFSSHPRSLFLPLSFRHPSPSSTSPQPSKSLGGSLSRCTVSYCPPSKHTHTLI